MTSELPDSGRTCAVKSLKDALPAFYGKDVLESVRQAPKDGTQRERAEPWREPPHATAGKRRGNAVRR